MAGVKAIDDTTLEVTLSYAFADWPYVVAHPALAPVPKALVEGGVDYNGAKVPFAEMPVGNGPFKMSEPWKHDQYIKVVAQRRLLRQEAEHRWRRLHDLQGPGDRVPRVPGRQPRLHADPRRPDRGRQDVVRRLRGRLHRPAGQGRTARRRDGDLLLHAQQREGAAGQPQRAQGASRWRSTARRSTDRSTRAPASSPLAWFPRGSPATCEDQWPDCKYDVAAAKQALVEAGFPEGKGLPTLTINYNVGAGHDKVVRARRVGPQGIGINTKLETLEGAQHWDLLRTTQVRHRP